MRDEKETRKKLQESAKEEFLTKGFMQASLRNICKNAGVTTGALYFFFKDKEDLFASLVQEPLSQLYHVMNQHYQDEMEQADQVQANQVQTDKWDSASDIETARMVVHYLYEHYDTFQLLIQRSQGSTYENCIDQFVEITEEHYKKLMNTMTKKKGKQPLDDYFIHWIAHMNIDVFVHLLTHEDSEQEAQKHVPSIVNYMIAGWLEVLRTSE